MKRMFDTKASPKDLWLGDVVLKWDELKCRPRKHMKFDAMCAGLYIITESTQHNAFHLSTLEGEELKILINGIHLKWCFWGIFQISISVVSTHLGSSFSMLFVSNKAENYNTSSSICHQHMRYISHKAWNEFWCPESYIPHGFITDSWWHGVIFSHSAVRKSENIQAYCWYRSFWNIFRKTTSINSGFELCLTWMNIFPHNSNMMCYPPSY